jgi:hypothetical protein
MNYRCQSKLQRKETEVLVVCCSDHRFQAGLREFLDNALSLAGNCDYLIVPGGPQCLVEATQLPKFSWASRRWSHFLIEGHKLKRLILIAHQDCAWYKWLGEERSASAPIQAPIREWQESDLRYARDWLVQRSPDLTVDLFFAGWDAEDAITVESV